MSQCVPGATISLFVMKGQSEHFLQHSTQSNYLCSGDQVHVQTFLPKMDMTSSEHHMMTYIWHGTFGWWHSHHIYVRVQGTKGWMHRGRGSQFWEFKCRAYRVELIPSRLCQCVPTSGQPGILKLTTTSMHLVYWLISISIFLWSKPCSYWIWLPTGPAKRTRVPHDKDHHP